MDSLTYRKLKQKEDKTETEWELLRATQTLRIISEQVTDATKGKIESDVAIATIREALNNND